MEGPSRGLKRKEEREGDEWEKKHLVVGRQRKKAGVSAVPFYDGLVKFAMFSPVAVNCRNSFWQKRCEESRPGT